MDRKMIAMKARQIESKEQLLNLLNQIKKDEMAEDGMDNAFYPFTMKHINCYCNPNNSFHRYKQFNIKKKSGGTRKITAPSNQSFMLLLKYVNEILKALYTPSDYAMGFTEGRSVVTNASIHKGQNYIFNIDLKDFFPSIEQARVWKRLQLEPICLKQPIANVIAGLCCMKIKDDNCAAKYVLPQGAPTSPILTNMICDKLDRRVAGLAKRFGLHYSRYADDITFSSMHNVYQTNGVFRSELQRIIEGQGFTMNNDKTRFQKIGSRQEVTGVIVSDKLNVTQNYVRDIRNILYIWSRYGFDAAYNKFFPKYKAEKGHVKKGEPDIVNVLDGKLMYLKMVKGDGDSVYLRLKQKFELLVEQLHDSNNTNDTGVKFISTTPVLEFENNYNTTICITISKPKDSCIQEMPSTANEDKTQMVETFVLHRYATFSLGGIKQKASVNKLLTSDEEIKKELLSISHCRDKKGEMFWLIHRSDKVMIPSIPVDIDELNDELDNLLD